MRKSTIYRTQLLIFIITIIPVFLMSGCKQNNNISADNSKTIVAVSIVPQKTFVEAVCGDLAEVVVMVPPGYSPANYEPTPVEMEKFSRAKVYFSIGVPTEASNIMPKAQELEGIKIVKLEDIVAKIYPDRELTPGNRDPHIWLSPKRVIKMVESIADEMGKIDVKNKENFNNNANQYIIKLQELDAKINASLEGVQNRKIIVFHPSFGYLSDDYNLEMFALEQDGKEASPSHLKDMIDFAGKEGIKAIFYQAEISSQQAEAFAAGIDGKTVQLAPLAPNYIENLEKMAALIAEVME